MKADAMPPSTSGSSRLHSSSSVATVSSGSGPTFSVTTSQDASEPASHANRTSSIPVRSTIQRGIGRPSPYPPHPALLVKWVRATLKAPVTSDGGHERLLGEFFCQARIAATPTVKVGVNTRRGRLIPAAKGSLSREDGAELGLSVRRSRGAYLGGQAGDG